MIDAIKTVGVLGLGVMGFRHRVSLRTERLSERWFTTLRKRPCKTLCRRRDQTIERLKKRNRISEIEVESVKNGLVPAASLSDMASAALVTEAVSESGKTKKSVYRTLARNRLHRSSHH